MKNICLTVLIVLFFSAEALADTIYLKNGNKVSGVIEKEADEYVEIKINIGAMVTFYRQDIEKIEKDSDEKNISTVDAWESEKASRPYREPGDDSLKKKRTTEGLVEHEGEWVSPEEKEKLDAANIATEADKGYGENRFSLKKDNRKRSTIANKLLDKGNWFFKETEHFSIFYSDLSQAKIVSDKAEYYFEKIAYDLGYEKEIKWGAKCQVYIVENVDKWKYFLKDIGLNAELVGGFVPNYDEREMFLCALSDGYLAATFPHELTHLIFKEMAGNSTIPLWLNEGLANYEASVTSISNELLIKRIKQARHILLGDILRMANYPEGKEMRELFYAQSEKMVELLITQYGRKKFRGFCEIVFKDRSFKDAIADAYKNDFADMPDFNVKLVEYIVK